MFPLLYNQVNSIRFGQNLLRIEPRSDTSAIRFSVNAPEYAAANWSLGVSIVDLVDVISVSSEEYQLVAMKPLNFLPATSSQRLSLMCIPQGDVTVTEPFKPSVCLPGYHLSADGASDCSESSGLCDSFVCTCDTVHTTGLLMCEENKDKLILKVFKSISSLFQ